MKTTDKAFGCVGSTIRLSSGVYLDLLNPDPRLITIRDVSRGLANICRFGGQCDVFYSVAEHSIACAGLAHERQQSRKFQLVCLMHDAAEAFIGDVVKPLKILIEPLYGPIEEKVEAAIAEAFDVDFVTTRDDWKLIDRTMLIAERRALFTPDKVAWAGEDEVARIEYKPRFLNPFYAAMEFESAFRLLTAERAAS